MSPGATLRRAAHAGARRPIALVWAGTFLYSTGPVMVAAASVSGPVLSFWRLWMGVVIMGGATLVHIRVSGERPDRTGWTWAAKAGIAFGLHQLAFMSAVKATSVVDVTLMQVLSPVLVGLLAVPLFGERPRISFRLWSVVAMAGAAVVVLAGSTGPEGAPLGMALATANVLFFVMYFLWSKQARGHIDVVPFLFGAVLGAAVTVSAFVLVAGESPGSARPADFALAAAIAVVPGAFGHFISTWPLKSVPANIPPVVQLTLPFLASGLAWVVLAQGVTALHVVGGLVTVIGAGGAILSRAGRELAAGTGEAAPVPGAVPGP